ncbi:hypothetical protein BGX30_005023 [Mortierella sp. GBA39]|nr:hypothetical protein BGX30_005023 [Mortierella sp. GBA39]
MAPRKRKQGQKQTRSNATNGHEHTNGNGNNNNSNNDSNGNAHSHNDNNNNPSSHDGFTGEVKEAFEKLTNVLPKNAKVEVRHPTLSRNPSITNYLRQTLFVNDVDVQDHKKHVPAGTRRRVILLLGIIIGMGLATVLMRQSKDAAYMEAFSHYFQDFDLASMVPSGMIPDEFIGNVSAMFKPEILTEEEFYPGEELREELGYKPKYPVTMIPGIVSTGLESWSTTNNSCSQKYFRKRMWGTTTMFKAVLLDKECWISNLRLDPKTGLDPEGVRLRAAQGLEAADYLFQGYWVWAPIIKNLAAIGYDNNNMYLASYDWRLSFANLENRDNYFSRLKSNLELSLKVTGEKSVLLAHSMGSNVMFYFFKWVESDKGGKGGPNWVNDHVHTFVNIAGPMLGVPKTLAAVLSGEVRDTAQLGVVSAYVLEKFFSRRERADLFRSWGGLSSMIPKGGNRIWGTISGAPDDGTHDEEETVMNEKIAKSEETPGATTKGSYGEQSPTFGAMLAFAEGSNMENYGMDESMGLLSKMAGDDYNAMLAHNYTVGASVTQKQMDKTTKDPASWTNPLEATLPYAPKMKIYCLYGVGKSTERSYTYNRVSDLAPQIFDQRPGNVSDETGQVPNIYIDTSVHDDKLGISYGVHQGDGDGTVPLMSTGYMCVDGWSKKLYNPAGVKVITREFTHQSSLSPVDIRGGKRTADHVDILGNYQVTKDLLAIVAGRDGDGLEEQIYSKIKEYSANVDI